MIHYHYQKRDTKVIQFTVSSGSDFLSVYPLEYSHRPDWAKQLVNLPEKRCVRPGFSKTHSFMVAFTTNIPSMMQLF